MQDRYEFSIFLALTFSCNAFLNATQVVGFEYFAGIKYKTYLT